MKKFVKVAFKNNGLFSYKENEINIADVWNPSANNPQEYGGFNFSTEEKILRWLIRGDILYDVIIPDTTNFRIVSEEKGIYRANQIIVTNPRPVTDEVAMYFYKISDLPWTDLIQAASGCAIMGYINTARTILKENINEENKEEAISIIKNWFRPEDEIKKKRYAQFCEAKWLEEL